MGWGAKALEKPASQFLPCRPLHLVFYYFSVSKNSWLLVAYSSTVPCSALVSYLGVRDNRAFLISLFASAARQLKKKSGVPEVFGRS